VLYYQDLKELKKNLKRRNNYFKTVKRYWHDIQKEKKMVINE
jgi:hypothetical protein